MTLASVSAAPAFDDQDWVSEYYRDHPLVGSVWRRDGSATDLDTVMRAVEQADYVLVGETHPNPDHHLLQARIIDTMSDAGRRPAVVMEMIPAGLQDRLDAHLRETPGDAGGLGASIDWEKRGWPDWAIYQPIAQAALDHGLPIKAGDLDKDVIRLIGRSGAAALEREHRTQLGLDRQLSAEMESGLLRELKISHCDLLPEAALKPMLTVQRARDGALAAAMIAAGQDDGAILIAGNGHVRNDWAVPSVLLHLAPDANVISIGLIEVDKDLEGFADYTETSADAGLLPELPYDFVIFSPRSELTDHCAELAERFANPD